MIKDQLHSIFNETFYSGPVPVAEIELSQKKLGLLFPPSYRAFLEIYGATFSSNIYIAGIEWPAVPEGECPQWCSVVNDTLSKRPSFAPENSIAISNDGGEMTYHLTCSQNDKNFEGVVIQWGAGANSEKPFANSFLQFCENFEKVYEGT